MEQKINVLQLNGRSDIGGGPQVMYNLLVNIKKDTFRFFVAAPNEEPFFPKLNQIPGVTVFSLNLRDLKWSNLIKLSHIVKENNINIVHSHGKGAGIWSRMLKILFPRLIVIHHFHGIHYKQYPKWAHKFYFLFEKITSFLTDKIIHVSESEQQEARDRINIAFPRQQVICNGVRVPFLSGDLTDINKQKIRQNLNLPKNVFLIVCVARYSFAKNLEHSFRIIRKLRDRNIPVHYVIVGGEDDISEITIKKYIKTEKIENHVTLAGSQLVVQPWLEAADVFLSTSRWEGLPTAVMEAMSSRLPVVASDVTGNRSLMNESNGFLIEETNTEEFCTAIATLYESPQSRVNCGIKGRKMIERSYSINKMVHAHEKLYHSFELGEISKAATINTSPANSVLVDSRMMKGSGISTYITNLLYHFRYLEHKLNIELMTQKQNFINHNNKIQDIYPIHRFNQKIYSIGEQLYLPRVMKQHKILHVPHYNAPLIYRGILIVTIHDICHYTMSQFFPGIAKRLYSSLFLKQVLKRADQIITVSEFSKSEIQSHFDISGEKIEVIYNGVDSHFYPRDQDQITDVKKRYQLPNKYLLYVGNIRPHKNVAGLVNGYAHAWRENSSIPPLVLCGLCQQGYNVFRELTTFSSSEKKLIRQQVIFTGYVKYMDLPNLYSGAEAFLYMSFYEGFGIPPLEAMACGIPVVASSSSAISEVCGSSAMLVHPDDPNAIAAAIHKILNDSDLRLKLSQYANERLKKYSWKTSAEKHLKIYQKWLTACS